MVNFALKRLFDIKGRIPFYQLVVDNIPVFDSFISTLNVIERSYIGTIKFNMGRFSILQFLPKTKFRDITPKGEKYKEYEFKKNRMRTYCIKTSLGIVIILCGFKEKQKNDIVKFRNLKKKFLDDYEN